MASAWSQLDQLLTCAICLDRYRNPKLLPCQHTFCMEPCLDGLIDYARRQIKCPECRAEHRIPYQGIQQFPTNVTLMRFLELHRDITGEEPEPPPSLMERCNVCSEKSNVERCAHCDKKICTDCKEAHVDILRREINRINNQVRRGLHKLSEALTQTKKNADKLQLNCKQVKEEIDDIVKRYSKDLKVTEDKLKHDLETYTQSEMKSIAKLKEDLEIEVNNISSNCELVDKYVKDDYEWSDVELLEYKQIFLKMLDFLRTFDIDNSDFTRKIKFQPRADPDVLHRNIADFGELKINAPMNPVPTQQTLMPNSNALMRSQSDHRLAAQFARRCDNRSFSDINQRMDNDRDSGRPTSPLSSRNRRDTDGGYRRYSERSRDYDYPDRVSNRYSREDTALSSRWRDSSDDYSHRNRYSRDFEEADSEPHQGRTVRFADEPQQPRERIFDLDDASKGPLSGVVKLLDSPKVLERLHQNEVKQKLSEKEKPASTPAPTPAPVTPTVTQTKRPTTRQQSEDDIDRQKRENQQASSSTTPTSSQKDTVTSSRKSSTTDSTRAPPTTESSQELAGESSPNRRRLSGTTSFDDSTVEPPRIQSRQVSDIELDKKDTEVGNSKDLVGLRDNYTPPRRHIYTRHQSDTRYDRPSSMVSEQDTKQDIGRYSPNFLSSSRPTTPTRRFTLDITGQERPNYNRYRSIESTRIPSPTEDARSPTSRYSPLCRRTSFLPTISSLEPTSNDDSCCSSDSTANVFFSCNSSLEDISVQSPGYSRSPLVKTTSLDAGETSRKPLDKKLPPRAATPVHHNDEEDSEESDDEENTYQPAPEPPKPIQSSFFSRQRRLPEPEPRLLEMHETDNEDESESEEESEEDEEEGTSQEPATTTPNEPKANTASDSEEDEDDDDDEEEESSDSSTTESEESEEESADPVFENKVNPSSTVAGKPSTALPKSNEHTNSKSQISDSEEDSDEAVEAHNKVSDDDDDEEEDYDSKPDNDSSRRRSSIDKRSHRSRKRSDDTDTTDSSSASSSTNYHSLSRTTTPLVTSNASEDQVSSERSGNDTSSSRFRRRPFLARSKSSHELGLGFDSNSGVDEDDDQSPDPIPSYRSRTQRTSEDFPRTRSIAADTPTSNSNSCWAKYLNNKYGSNAANRVVPRSRSSHSLFHKSDSESSEEEPSGRDPVLSNSYGFSNPRSNYMQKRRMLLKIGARGSEPGHFTWPRGVAVGPDNSIVVADSSNHRIQVFDSIGKFLFEFGTYGSGEGEFDCLAGVSVNRIGQFIVSDRYNNRIQLFDPTGRFLRAFGCEGRTDGRFSYPWGIATDSLGFIYVCDKENHRIQVFQSDGTFVGKFGSIGSRPGQLEHPHYIAVTNTNRVVVSDTNNHRVQIFDVNGRSLTTFGSEGSEEGHFKFPKGVAVDDQGYIIVGDGGNNRVQVFQPDGTFLRSFGGWGAGDGEFKGLEGLAVTSGGSIIVCDRENHRIQVF